MKTLIALMLLSTAANAMNCGQREPIVNALKERYQETQRNVAIAGVDVVTELYLSPEGATWTIIMSFPDGRTCIFAAGKGWTSTNPLKQGKVS